MKPDHSRQIAIEKLYNKNELLPRLKEEFDGPELRAYCEKHDFPLKFAISFLAQLVLHKRAGLDVLIGLLQAQLGQGMFLLQECADLIYRAIEMDLADWDDITQVCVIRHDVSPEVYADLERYQFPLPMIVPPMQLTNNMDCGYLTMRKSVISKGYNHHNHDVCLDHLNRVNKIPLVINNKTANMVANQWRNLDRKKPDETDAEYKTRLAAFEKYDRVSRDVIDHLNISDGPFYLTHRYDKRGRCYASG